MRRFKFCSCTGTVDRFGYVRWCGASFHYTDAKGDLRTLLNNLMEL